MSKRDPVCPYGKCDGSGWVPFEDTEIPCRCLLDERKRRRLRRINKQLPAKYASAAIDRNPVAQLHPTTRGKLEKWIQVVEARAVEDQERSSQDARRLTAIRGLWLTGKVGQGKTFAAAALLRRTRETGFTASFFEVPELLSRLRATFGDGATETPMQVRDELQDVDLLVLDDMGAGRSNDWALEELYILINRRYKDEKPTIVTSNLDVEGMAKTFGWRITRRLHEPCGEPLLCNRDWQTEAAA